MSLFSRQVMSLLQVASLILITYIRKCTSATLVKTIQPSGEIWLEQSGLDLEPTWADSYNTIQLGQVMSIEFDFKFYGRSNDANGESGFAGWPENFFRIGHSAKDSADGACDGEKSAYPAMFLAKSSKGNILNIKVSSGTSCTSNNYLTDYEGELNTNISHHMKISLNNTQVVVEITGGGKSDYSKQWPRQQTPKDWLGNTVDAWFLSNTFYDGLPYNRGWGSFNNIIIKSNIFTFAPTAAPTETPTTSQPTNYPTTHEPTNYPTTITPTTSIPTTSIPTTITPTTSVPTTNAPTNYPTTKQPTEFPPTSFPTKTPTFTTISPTYTPTTNAPTNYPTTKQPTEFQPTSSPTKPPTNNPTISPTISTNNPTQSPVIDAGVVETTTQIPDNTHNGPLGGNDSKGIIDSTSLGIIIAVSVVSICIICGIIILYKQRQKRKTKDTFNKDSDYYRGQQHMDKEMETQLELGVNEINVNSNYNYNNNENINDPNSPYTPEGVIKSNITGFNNNNNEPQEQYLSEAQKQVAHSTPGGPLPPVSNNENNNYLSDAQKQDLNVTKMGLEEYNNDNMNMNIELQIEDDDDENENENDIKYLSEAQQKQAILTAGGSGRDDSIYDKPNDYLSEAQREEMRNNPNLQIDVNTSGGVKNDEFVVKNSDTDHTSDEEVLDNLGTPGGFHENNIEFVYKNSPPIENQNNNNDGNEYLSEAQQNAVAVTAGGGNDNMDNVEVVYENDDEIERNITIGAMSMSNDNNNNNEEYDEQYDDDEYEYDENVGSDDLNENFETIQ